MERTIFRRHLIHSLSYTIMLSIVWNCDLMFDPMLEKVDLKFIRCILSSIISAKSSQYETELHFESIHEKNLKFQNLMIFSFSKYTPTHPCVIINKSHDISIATCRRNRHRATQIK
jgi:hypothetical protein